MSSTSSSATVIPTGTWSVDPAHSTVGFAVKHMGIANVRGQFGDFQGTLEVGEDLSSATAFGTVKAASRDDVDSFVHDIGVEAMRLAEPNMLASYLFSAVEKTGCDRDKCDFRQVEHIYDEVLKLPVPEQAQLLAGELPHSRLRRRSEAHGRARSRKRRHRARTPHCRTA